jgi:hypothetical protein
MSVPYAGGYLGLGNSFTSQNRVVIPVGGWVELGRDTSAGGTDPTLDVSFDAKRYYQILYFDAGSAGAPARFIRPNSDTGSNYSRRLSSNGAADATAVSQTSHNGWAANNVWPQFAVQYYSNLAAKEKLMISHSIMRNVTGAGTSPDRVEFVGKWANTADDITSIEVARSSGNFNAGDEIVVLGWDPADTHTTNFWEELDDFSWSSGGTITSNTFTAKKYLWVQGWYKTDGTNGLTRQHLNGDSGANYSTRYSLDGGTDVGETGNTGTYIQVQGDQNNTFFFNQFIINISAKEKLQIHHIIYNNTSGAANAPKRNECIGKWTNTSSQITSFDIGRSSGNYPAGQIKVWGSD